MFCLYPWEVCRFLNRNRGEVNGGGAERRGEGLGGEEEGENAIGMQKINK